MLRTFAAVLILLLPVLTPAADSRRPAYDNPPVPIHWNKNSIRIAVSQSITIPNVNINRGSDVVLAVSMSLKAWERAANLTFEQVYTDKLTVSPSGAAGDGVNLITIAQTPENVLMFDKGVIDASARTRVFVDRNGFITEADIVLNPFQQFSTNGQPGTYDLQSVLTHEIGHLLGLDHSPVIGSTMFEGMGKNGTGYSGIQNRFARTLSAEDVTAVRSLYGPAENDEDGCCGSIAGKLTAPRNIKDLKVWVENADTADVVGVENVSADGNFQVGGLATGKYRLLVQNGAGSRIPVAAYELPSVEVSKDKTVKIAETVKFLPASSDLRYIGLSDMLGTIAVPVNRGLEYKFSVGASKLPEKFEIGSDSPYIEVATDACKPDVYNDSTSSVTVTLRVRPDAPLGDYSLYLKGENGGKRYLFGAIAVESFKDPQALFVGTAF